MESIRKQNGNTPCTGNLKFGDDWTGVFLRGDDSLYYAMLVDEALNHLIGNPKVEDIIMLTYLENLSGLLKGCAHSDGKTPEDVQQLKEFGDCKL